jgi:acetolactate decarboxylase
MKKIFSQKNIFLFLILFLIGFNLLAYFYPDKQIQDVLFQTAPINNLLEGSYDGTTSISQLKRYGNFGIGTYDKLDGEMLVLDGNFYKIKSDGKAYLMPDQIKTPFAMITSFETDKKLTIKQAISFAELQKYIESNLPDPNLIYAIKISGNFSYIKTRSVPAQQKPYPKLVEVVKNQSVFEFNNTSGNIVGYWLPEYLKGVNATGFHLHFLTKNQQNGGHILDVQLSATNNCTIELDYTQELHLILPKGNTSTLKADNEKALNAVEKSH